jgi:hypothetical protein
LLKSIAHPAEEAATATRNQLLAEAAQVSRFLGAVVLPSVLVPLHAQRMTAAQLEQALAVPLTPSRAQPADPLYHETASHTVRCGLCLTETKCSADFWW